MIDFISWNCQELMNKLDEIRDISDHWLFVLLYKKHIWKKKMTKSQFVVTAIIVKFFNLGIEPLVVLLCWFQMTFFIIQGGQRTWSFWKPGKVGEFCGTCKMSGNFVKLGKVREFYLRETNIVEIFSKFIQVVNKN